MPLVNRLRARLVEKSAGVPAPDMAGYPEGGRSEPDESMDSPGQIIADIKHDLDALKRRLSRHG